MSRREQILAGLVLLLVGVLIGLGLMWLLSDDDADTEAGGGDPTTTTSSPTTTASTTTSTTAPTTTSSTTTTSTTTTTTTTMPPPTIDAPNALILGLAIGEPLDSVVATLTAKHGAPDADFGWSAACEELNPGGPPDWRSISFGDLRLQFFRGDGPEVLKSWRYLPRFGASEEPETVDYADVVLHDGVEWFDPLADVAEALDSTVVTDELGFVYVPTATTTYEWSDYLGDAVFDSLNAGDSLVCE